jgi:hypothetical protein
MTKWEYCVWLRQEEDKGLIFYRHKYKQEKTYNDAEEMLNALGNDGWELVSVSSPVIKLSEPPTSAPQSKYVFFYFKRAKSK